MNRLKDLFSTNLDTCEWDRSNSFNYFFSRIFQWMEDCLVNNNNCCKISKYLFHSITLKPFLSVIMSASVYRV